MPYELKGKVIIITGANSGIGKAASIQLAKFGAMIVLVCRSKERGIQAIDEVRYAANSSKIELMQVDMSCQGLAADPVGEQRTGGYWDAPGIEVKANKNAYNIETQKRLWAVSALLTGVKTI